MNDLANHLRNAATDWDGLPGHDDEEIIHYITCKKAREIADNIDAQEALIGEIMFGLRLEFGPAGPSRSTPLGRIFGEWLEEHRSKLG